MIKLNIDEFKNNVKDYVRANRFTITFDGDVASRVGFSDETLYYSVKSASLPSKTITDIEISWFGQQYKIGGDITFDDYTVIFLQDYDFKIKNNIEKWLQEVANHNDGIRGEHDNYKGTLTVYQLGNVQDEVLRKYKLIGVFPKQMNANELSMESTDSAQELEVTFSYDYWEQIA